MKTKDKNQKIMKLVELAILFALVIVLQSISVFGLVPISLCLIPITLGAMILGPKGGAILGFAFGVIVAFWGIVGKDGFTFLLFNANPVMTVVICLVKGTMAGLVAGLLYQAISKSRIKGSQLIASIVASISVPIVNTGLFVVGCLIIKEDVVSVCGKLGFDTTNYIALLFLTLIGVNFFIEFGVNAVFSPVLNKIVTIVAKKTGINKQAVSEAPTQEQKPEESVSDSAEEQN